MAHGAASARGAPVDGREDCCLAAAAHNIVSSFFVHGVHFALYVCIWTHDLQRGRTEISNDSQEEESAAHPPPTLSSGRLKLVKFSGFRGQRTQKLTKVS